MDLIQTIVAHLSTVLGVRVATERPEKPPDEFVTVRLVGSTGAVYFQQARVVVHAWSTSDLAAYRLGKRASDAMFDLPAVADNVVAVTQDSFYPNNYTDGTRRYSSAFLIPFNR